MYFTPYVCAVCSSKVKGRFVIKFSDIALDLTQFRQQMGSTYSIILRYATSEGIRVHDPVCKPISYDSMAAYSSLHIVIR